MIAAAATNAAATGIQWLRLLLLMTDSPSVELKNRRRTIGKHLLSEQMIPPPGLVKRNFAVFGVDFSFVWSAAALGVRTRTLILRRTARPACGCRGLGVGFATGRPRRRAADAQPATTTFRALAWPFLPERRSDHGTRRISSRDLPSRFAYGATAKTGRQMDEIRRCFQNPQGDGRRSSRGTPACGRHGGGRNRIESCADGRRSFSLWLRRSAAARRWRKASMSS